MMLWKCCTQYTSKFGKLRSDHRTGKGQFSFQSQHLPFPIKACGMYLRKATPGGLGCIRGVAWSIQWINLWLHVGSLLPLELKTIREEFWLQLRSSALRHCPLSLLCKYWLVTNLQFLSFTTQNGAWVQTKSAFPIAGALESLGSSAGRRK